MLQNKNGITGWVEEEGGITGGHMHMCAFKDCACRIFKTTKYGTRPPPEHVRFIYWADPAAEATVVGPLVSVPLPETGSVMAEQFSAAPPLLLIEEQMNISFVQSLNDQATSPYSWHQDTCTLLRTRVTF